MPPAQNKLPELKAEFSDLNEKGAFVNSLIGVCTKAMTDADNLFSQFQFPESESEYICSIDGFMHLMKITSDDANFQNFCKQKLTYLLDKAEKCKRNIMTQLKSKKVGGFYDMNDNPDTLN